MKGIVKNTAILATLLLLGLIIHLTVGTSLADDTDLYSPSVQHNAIISLDTSGSMDNKVYERYIDFQSFIDQVASDYACSDLDLRSESCPFTAKAWTSDRIYMFAVPAGYDATSGSVGDIGYNSSLDDYEAETLYDTGTTLSDNGTLSGGNLTVDPSTGHILYSGGGGGILPNNRDIAADVWQTNPDNSMINTGFIGQLQAPGFYFSGYFPNSAGNLTSDPSLAIDNGRAEIKWLYFFATGNYLNFHRFINLRVDYGPRTLYAADEELYSTSSSPVDLQTWFLDFKSPNYPNEYPDNYDSTSDPTRDYVIQAADGVTEMYLHFDNIYLSDPETQVCTRYSRGRCRSWSTTPGDYIIIEDGSGTVVERIDGEYSSSDHTTPKITGNQATVKFFTNSGNVNTPSGGINWGFNLDKYLYKVPSASDGDLRVQSRLEVAVESIIFVIEETRGKINWGIFKFADRGDGGEAIAPLNASFNDDRDKQNLINQLQLATASGYTPLGETLQTVYNYYGSKTQQIYKNCNKSFVITLTDGFPTEDDNWGLIPGVDFSNAAWNDGVDFTGDPGFGSDANYYDDVAKYMYERSWPDDGSVKYTGTYTQGELIPADQRSSTPDNIITHNIGFNNDNPMLQHAADVAGGIYITAYSKSQLMSAFYSLGLLIAEYTSYTAPVVSVDETNRVQSGDKIYTAVFKPLNDDQWIGNLKKYGLTYGDRGCSAIARNEWYLTDKNLQHATDCDGSFIETTTSYWSLDANDGGQVDSGGVGQLIKNAIPDASTIAVPLTSGNTAFRPIYTFDSSGVLSKVGSDTISNADLGVLTDADRYKIINYLYGYTYDADVAGSPVLKRSWPLNSIIHSSPEIVDYTDSTTGALTHRYIVLGSNDGMLHVFDDADGSEKLALLPPDVLTNLQNMDPILDINKVYSVDGSIVQTKDSSGNKVLVFGLRRGGRAYYAININDSDPANWTIKWIISNSTAGFAELGYTFAKPVPSRIKTGETGDPAVDVYKNILIIPGGYDSMEDNYSEGADYDLVIPTDRTAAGATTPRNSMGKAIFIVDVDDASLLNFSTDTTYPTNEEQFIWPTDPATWVDANFNSVRAQMRYCFAADPTVVNHPATGYLQAAYLTDLFGQVWKIHTDYDDTRTPKAVINLELIFKINPLTDQHTAYYNQGNFHPSNYDPLTTDPRGTISPWSGGYTVGTGVNNKKIFITNPRKTFMSPEVSYAGNCYTDVPVLFLGTGDRVHPKFIGTHNGIYAFYDAHAYFYYYKEMNHYRYAATDPEYIPSTDEYDFTTDIFTEANLLNVSGGGLEPDVDLLTGTAAAKANMNSFLGRQEDFSRLTGDASVKGWYTLLDPELGNWNSEFPAVDDDGDHSGEKVISPMNLFAKVLYTPTYQPLASTDPCSTGGKARLRAVKYCTGNAEYNFYTANDDNTDPDNPKANYTRLDRYLDIGTSIPSGITILVREGKPEGFLSIDDKIIPLPELKFPKNLLPIYWRQLSD